MTSDTQPGDWADGWRYFGASTRNTFYLRRSMMPSFSPGRQTLMLSEGRACSGRRFSVLPTSPELTLSAERLRCLLLRRLRLPLAFARWRCRCDSSLDQEGDHRAACSRAGLLVSRGKILERMLARVCREAGARVATNVIMLRGMNVAGVGAEDGRQIDALASGLPLYQGRQLAADATLVSAVSADEGPRRGAARRPGVAL